MSIPSTMSGLFLKRPSDFRFREDQMEFHEIQRLPWLIVVTLVAIISCLVLSLNFTVLSRSALADKWPTYLLLSAPFVLIAAFFVAFGVVTNVQGGVASVRVPLFGGEKFNVSEVRQVQVITYRPLRDFGGWGLRYGLGGIMYSARGNEAVKVSLESGKVIFIGTSRGLDLSRALCGQNCAPKNQVKSK